MTNTANQTIVSQAPFSDLTSSQVSTEVSSKSVSPIKAVVVASMDNEPPKIHKLNRMKKASNINHSFVLIAPISFSFSLAILGASAVFFNSGGYNLYKTSGTRINATSPGTNPAAAQDIHVILIPKSAANF
ncbi:hypothetical protein D3C87_1202560 [compost metagenome]